MPAISGQCLDHVVLNLVGVLEFVNQQMRKTVAVSVTNLGIFPEQAHRLEQQITEVHGIGLLQTFLVALIDSGHLLAAVPSGDKLIGQQTAVFGLIDGGRHGARLKIFFGDIQLGQAIPDQALLILIIVDGKIAAIAKHLPIPTQDPRAGSMKSADPQTVDIADQALQAFAHFGRGLVGKGHSQNLPRLDPLLLNQIGDTMGQGTGFARTGPGQYQQRPILVQNRLALRSIKGRQQITHRLHPPWNVPSGPDYRPRPCHAG